MIEPSTRYVPHIVALLVLAGIPTLLHSLGRFDVDDCASPGVLLAPPDRAHAQLLSANERRRFDSFWGEGNWSAGHLPDAERGGRLHYVIARSYDPKAVYHWPEARVIAEGRPNSRSLEEVESRGERIPVHRAYYERDSAASPETVVAYLLVYHSEAVANPYLAQILSGPQQVLTGRRPMWLFIVYGAVEPSEHADAETRAHEWLAAAWERHHAACAP